MKRDWGLGALIVLDVVAALALALGALHLVRMAGVRPASEAQDRTAGVVAEPAETQDPASSEPSVPLEEGRITMTLCGSHETYVRTGEDYVEPGCHVRDREEGNLTSAVQVTGDVDTSTPGDYTVTYTVTNAAGMTDSCERIVHVTDDVEWDTDGIPVMMYHYVYDPANPPADLNANYVSTDELESHLAWLTEEGFYYPSWAELRAYIDGTHSLPAKSVILTFDDGEYGFLDYGIPLLVKYQVSATSFTECCRDDIEYVLTEYANPYVIFESHSFALHHAGYSGLGHGGAIYDLSEDELVEDITSAGEVLGSVDAFAYPYGDVSDVAPAAMERAGVLCAFTVDYGQVHVGADPAALPRVRVSGGNSLEGYQASVW